MPSPRALLFAFTLSVLPTMTPVFGAGSTSGESGSPAGPTLAVADFAGADRELGGFLAETLVTDLGQSRKLHLVECSELRAAFADLKLEPSKMLDAHQVQRLGRMIQAENLVVGSYLARDHQITINARVLDLQSGEPVPGGAGNVSGSDHNLLGLAHRLARRLHQRVANCELELGSEDADAAPTADTDSAVHAERQEIRDTDTKGAEPEQPRPCAFLPANARPNGAVTEGDLAGVLARVAQQLPSGTGNPFTVEHAGSPVTRLRALAALEKLILSPEDVATYRSAPPAAMPADAAQVPGWGQPFVAAAVAQGWWSADKPVRAEEKATWAFVAAVLSRMPVGESAAAPAAAGEPVTEIYTGLIVDAHDLQVQRTMGPRLLDEDGNVLYPDPKHVPSADHLQDEGMVGYAAEAQNARRSGSHPLLIHAVGVTGPEHADLIVSNETAQQIRQADARTHFLLRWAVSVVISPR